MLEALKAYLEACEYKNISLDYIPDPKTRTDAIALFEWEHTVGTIHDGTGVHLVQIQVRRETRSEAKAVCASLFHLLDSGPEERVIDLTPDVFCIARPRRGPAKLEAGAGYMTFYCEIALWGGIDKEE